jgi:cytochrome c oxidase assembly protein subunit 15
MAELHSSLALLLVGLALGLAVALHSLDVPERVRKGARMLVVVLTLQAAVGYAQYFTHLPAAVVELHELGATALVIGVVQFFLALTHHAPERAPRLRAAPDGRPAPAAAAGGPPGVAPGGGPGEGTATLQR